MSENELPELQDSEDGTSEVAFGASGGPLWALLAPLGCLLVARCPPCAPMEPKWYQTLDIFSWLGSRWCNYPNLFKSIQKYVHKSRERHLEP